jgi:hypothetical protein
MTPHPAVLRNGAPVTTVEPMATLTPPPIPFGSKPPVPSNLRPQPQSTLSDPNHLRPEDAFYAHSPPRKHLSTGSTSSGTGLDGTADGNRSIDAVARRKMRAKDRGRSGSRRRVKMWKKLMWVKQSCMCTYPPLITLCISALMLKGESQIRTIIQMRRRSSTTFNAILVSSPTISGRWSQTRPLLCSMSAQS